ncbi:SLAM family member 6 isoform X1 [Microcebus murinus]|uniref:SLAM family member 6 n=1 Tax=Microcebus murinus TaxID=30608 RepID=A0A8C5V7I4_MICMU|nr:SLAM family member 6 isoform X1 [Microcebus murinus]
MTTTWTASSSPAPASTAESMFWLFPSLLLVFCLGPGHVVSQNSLIPSTVNGVLGESVTLILKFPEGKKVSAITWLCNGTSIAFINLNEAKSPFIQVTDPKWRKRLNLTQSYSLHLSNLTMADTGSYSAQMTTEAFATLSSYTLRIFEKLRNINITSHSELSGNRTCEIHLTCSVENPDDNVSFRWQASGNILRKEPNLTISWDPQNSSEQKYTCIAENPIGNLSSSVSAQNFCKGFNKNPHAGIIRTTVIVATVLFIVFIGLCLFFVCRGKKGSHYWSPRQGQGPESTRNTENVSVSPASSTVYASVTHPNRETEIPTPMKNNDSVTIYSTINHSKQSKPTFPRETAFDKVI